ncbi:MAG: HD domain-containing protein [Clostridia bacterium]|nr:HD domain-containing protein [Clostridia bacterium]
MSDSKTFCENPVLMLEAICSVAESGGNMPDSVKNSISESSANIKYASRENVRDGIEKIIMSAHADSGIRLMFECGILKYILPQLDRCFYEPQRNKYHIYNVGEHIVKAVSSAPQIPVVRWAALFHDIGKPLCSSCDAAGIIHFYGHHIESVKIANDICHKFSFDSDMTREICTLVEYHDVHFEPTEKGVKRALCRLGEQMFIRLLYLQEADAKAKSPRYYNEKRSTIQKLHEIRGKVISTGEPYRYSDMAIGKRDLIKMKYHAERQMRDVLKILFDEIIENPSLNNREYLLKRAQALKNKR